MQDQAGPLAGCPPRPRSVAEMDGCSRQNPAYRSATERGSARSLVPSCRPPPGMRTCVRVIVCVLLPRFELAVAAGGREALAAGPLALAPQIGREPLVGETSAAAEAYGVRAGLRLGEALARCPTLRLVTPDPAGVADAWERVVAALEGIGAAVESDHPGTAWFEEQGLRGLHGGSVEGVIRTARRALAAATRGERGGPPSLLAAFAAPAPPATIGGAIGLPGGDPPSP